MTALQGESAKGQLVSKDKKKKKKAKKAGASSGARTLKNLAQNPLVADVVAAALVATASALRDSKRAQRLASEAGEELTKLAKEGSERGNALWDMALQIGRRSLEALAKEESSKRSRPKSRSAKAPAKKQASKRGAR